VTILTRPLERKLAWQNFGGPCEYAQSGTKRVTYWLRLGKEAHKVTNATPSAYDAMAGALHRRKRARGYERHCFGSAALEHAERKAAYEALATAHGWHADHEYSAEGFCQVEHLIPPLEGVPAS
jgi:hypothetical protein